MRLLGDDDLRIILQLLETAVGDNVSRVDARHGGHAAIGTPGLDVADLRRAILNDIDECCLRRCAEWPRLESG